MGFTFRSLASSALVSKNEASTEKNNVDVADIPQSVEGHTSIDGGSPDEKLGASRSSESTSDSDEELSKVDQTAQYGVQNAQAMTYVWTKRDLILAYVMYVNLTSTSFRSSLTVTGCGSSSSCWPSHREQSTISLPT